MTVKYDPSGGLSEDIAGVIRCVYLFNNNLIGLNPIKDGKEARIDMTCSFGRFKSLCHLKTATVIFIYSADFLVFVSPARSESEYP